MIRIGLLGYGNLSRGIEAAIKRNPDEELVAVFTRRDPASVKIHTDGVKVDSVDHILAYKDEIDVLMICGGRRHMHSTSTSSTASIPMRRFRSISPPSTQQRRRPESSR